MKISVIIPIYNGARFLEPTLDSVFAQTFPAHEVIAVDDGSTDASPEILRSYGDALVTIRKQNGGVASARNAGLARASGDAIAFIDQDDLWPEDRNRVMADFLAANPDAEVVAGKVEMLDQRSEPGPFVMDLRTVPREVLVGSLLVRSAVFARLGPLSTHVGYADDTDFLMRRLENGIRTSYLDIVSLVYRLHDNNTSADHDVGKELMLTVFRESLKRRRAARK